MLYLEGEFFKSKLWTNICSTLKINMVETDICKQLFVGLSLKIQFFGKVWRNEWRLIKI